MDFFERLQALMDSRGLSQKQLAEAIGGSQNTISDWKTKGILPNGDKAVKIAQYFNVSLDYLLIGDEHPNKCIVPILDQELSAGKGCLVPENDAPKGLLELPHTLRAQYGENLAALYVKGDSMEPTLHSGDLIVCDSLGWDSGEGLYVIRMNGNGYVKRIQVANDKIYIKSDNPNYETLIEPIESQSLQIVGKVHFIGTVNV